MRTPVRADDLRDRRSDGSRLVGCGLVRARAASAPGYRPPPSPARGPSV